MSSLYSKVFADHYDIRAESLIQNVGQELEFFRFVFDGSAKTSVHKILDVGCGTGRHYIPLTQEGYEVTGLDLSQNMLHMLKKKAGAAKLEAHIFRKDMREIELWSKEFFIALLDNIRIIHYEVPIKGLCR